MWIRKKRRTDPENAKLSIAKTFSLFLVRGSEETLQ